MRLHHFTEKENAWQKKPEKPEDKALTKTWHLIYNSFCGRYNRVLFAHMQYGTQHDKLA